MSLKDDIENKAIGIKEEKFKIEDISYIPKIDNSKLTFGNTGLLFESTVLFIDMRGSTAILNSHYKYTVAKIHKIYFHTIVKIANSLNGNVRSFNGDSALIFFQGTSKDTLSNCVKCAMKIKYMLSNSNSKVYKTLSSYGSVDFGIGIDDGKILCTKVGIGGENNRDLFWVGNPVNKSTVIGDQCSSPKHIGISNLVYTNLTDETKYGMKDGVEVNMWTKKTFTYNQISETYYYTSWYMGVV